MARQKFSSKTICSVCSQRRATCSPKKWTLLRPPMQFYGGLTWLFSVEKLLILTWSSWFYIKNNDVLGRMYPLFVSPVHIHLTCNSFTCIPTWKNWGKLQAKLEFSIQNWRKLQAKLEFCHVNMEPPFFYVVYHSEIGRFWLNTGCWQEAAGGLTGWVLDPPLCIWEWLGWYASEYHLNHCHMEKGGSKYQAVILAMKVVYISRECIIVV